MNLKNNIGIKLLIYNYRFITNKIRFELGVTLLHISGCILKYLRYKLCNEHLYLREKCVLV